MSGPTGTRLAPPTDMLPMTGLYQIWMSRGYGLHPGPKFRYFDDARRYVEDHRGEASLAVKGPDGEWEMIVARRRLARGTQR